MSLNISDYQIDRILKKKAIMFRLKHTNVSEQMELSSFAAHFFSKYGHVLVCEETSGGRHFQGIIVHEGIKEEELRTLLKEISPDAKGNKCLYVKEVKLMKQCLKYNLKEQQFLYQGFPKHFIDTMIKCSNKKENLRQKISDNEERLLSGDIKWQRFCVNYIQIKVDHGQNLYNNHIKSYFNRFLIKSGVQSSAQYYNTYFSEDYYV